MTETGTLLAALAALLAATLTRATLGFGDALVAMPLLAMLVGVQTATPLVALIGATTSVSILLQSWRSVDLRAAGRLFISSLAGIPLGLLLLKTVPEVTVNAILGSVLVAYGLYSLLNPRLPSLHDGRWAYGFGLVAGVLGGAYNTNGPPVVVYGALRDWSARKFRATLQGYFFPTGLAVLASHGLAGLWTPAVLRLYVYALPVTALGLFLGGRLSRRISGDRFTRVVYAFLLVVGLLLLVG